MAVVFLIGGTGNQLFQFSCSFPSDRFSGLFLKGLLPALLNWKQHERIFEYPKATRVQECLALVCLPLEIALSKIFGRTMFSKLDLRFASAEPLFGRLIMMGYFQAEPERRGIGKLRQQVANWPIDGDIPDVSVHIRGGDILDLEMAGCNPYGILPPEYYSMALERSGNLERITVFTDDCDYAGQIMSRVAVRPKSVKIDGSALKVMVAKAFRSGIFIGSNSTLSFWITRLRGPGKVSFCPNPYTRALAFRPPREAETIEVHYEDQLAATPRLGAARNAEHQKSSEL